MLMAPRNPQLPEYADNEAERLYLERIRQNVERMQWEAAMRMPDESDPELVRRLDQVEGRP